MKKIILFFKSLGYILLYFMLSLIIQLILYKDITGKNILISNLSLLLTELIVLLVIVIIFRKNLIPDFYEFKKNFKNIFKKNILTYIIGLSIMIFSNLLINFIVGFGPTNEELNVELINSHLFSSIITLTFIAPITEELITRANFKHIFKNKYLFIFTSGLIFGLLHLLSTSSLLECLYIIPYAALGIAFAKMYWDSNNIWTSILFHSIHNFIALTLLFI